MESMESAKSRSVACGNCPRPRRVGTPATDLDGQRFLSLDRPPILALKTEAFESVQRFKRGYAIALITWREECNGADDCIADREDGPQHRYRL